MTLKEIFEDVPEYMKPALLKHIFSDDDGGRKAWYLIERLLVNGCPVDVIVRTLDDLAIDSKRRALRDMLGEGFDISFEGED